MKTLLADHFLYDDSMFEETEMALAISPCPNIKELKDTGEFVKCARQRSGIDRRRRTRKPSPAGLDENARTNALAIVWIIALAIAVAIGIYFAGA